MLRQRKYINISLLNTFYLFIINIFPTVTSVNNTIYLIHLYIICTRDENILYRVGTLLWWIRMCCWHPPFNIRYKSTCSHHTSMYLNLLTRLDYRSRVKVWHCDIQCYSVTVCDTVTLWHCASVALWHCDTVALWHCHSVALRQCDV